MKTKLIAITLACALFGANAMAQSGSQLSEASGDASGVVVIGTLSAVAGSAYVVVTGVEQVGDSTVVALKNVSDGATATVKLSGQAAQGASQLAGKAVSVTATASGHVLIAAGKVIAFIPNEIGKALLHTSPSGAKE